MIATKYQRLHVWLLDNGEDEFAAIADNLGTTFEGAVGWLGQRGFSIVPKLQDGQQEVNVGLLDRIRNVRSRTPGIGSKMVLGGWSQNRSEARADAEKTNGLIAREGVEGLWISTGEFEYKGAPDSPAWKRLGQFVSRAQEIQPLAAIMLLRGGWGFCSLPNEPAGPDFDWSSVKRVSGRWVPQCYPNEQVGAPNQWPSQAQRLAHAGDPPLFASSFVHPVIGMHTSQLDVPAARYITDLVAAKTVGFTYGFGIYGSHQVTREEWEQLAAVVKPAGTTGPRVLAWC